MLTRVLRRPGLLLAAVLLVPFAGAILVGTSRAQPPFGPPGRPPGFPGGPRGPGGIPGGPLGPGGGFAGGGIGRPQWEFTCSKCRRVLGTSDSPLDKPPYDKCPYCGVRFANSDGWNRGGSTFRPEEGAGAGEGAPPIPPVLGGGGGGGGFTPPSPPVPPAGVRGPAADRGSSWDEDEEDSSIQAPFGKRILLAGVVGLVGLVVIVGVVGLILLVSRAGGGSKRPRRRRLREREREPSEEEYEMPQPRSRVRRY